MKTTIATLALFFIAIIAVNAQDTNKSLDETAKYHADRLSKTLDLDEDQKTKVYRQYYSTEESARRLKNMDATAEDKKAMAKQYMVQMEDNFRKILDDNQYKRYQEVKDDHYNIVENRTTDRMKNKTDKPRSTEPTNKPETPRDSK